MLWRTHFLFGASVGLLVSSGDPGSAAASAGIAGVSALLPDLDSPDSRLGRLVPVVSWLLKTTVGHRGPLHSLLAVVGVYLLALVLLPPVAPLVAAGYFSHLVADSLNPQGVPWLWPLRVRLGLPFVQTGGLLERLVLVPSMVVLCGWLSWPIVTVVVSKIRV